MRIADKMAFGQVNNNILKNRTEMAQLQNEAATQKRVTKPSDDPLAAARVLSARTDEKGATQFIKNLNIAKSFLDYTDQSLGELNDAIVRAKDLAINQSSDGSSTPDSKKGVAAEVSQIYAQMVQIGNRKLGDRYIFGGNRTLNMPFDQAGNYHGDDADIRIQINKESFMPMNIAGNKVFLGQGIDQSSKTTLDTPLTLEELKSWKASEKQRIEKQQNKEFEPTKLEYRGLASIENPELNEEMDTLDTTGTNVFEVIRKLEIGLQTDDKQVVQESLDNLDRALAQVILARSQIGSRAMALDTAMDSLQKTKVDTKIAASQMEDADVFQTMSDITQKEGALKATLETSGKMIQPSLLDFLR